MTTALSTSQPVTTQPTPQRARQRARRRPIGRWCLLGLLSCTLAAVTAVQGARAATVLELDLAGLVERADVIAVGQVRESQARKEGHTGLIVTDVAFGVLRPLKGKVSVGDRVVITTLGGRLPNLALSVPGEAVFTRGETALVFLRRTRHGELRVVGMAQGRMPVTGSGASAVVTPSRTALVRLSEAADAAGNDGHGTTARPQQRSLREIIEDIADLIARKP